MWHFSNTLQAQDKKREQVVGQNWRRCGKSHCVFFSFFSPLLAEQDVALFGVAWFRCGWDGRWGRLLIALGQCLIGYVPLVSNVGARAVNGTVWVSAVVLVVIVKGSLIRCE